MQADRQRSLGLSGPHIDSRQRTAPWAIDQRGDQQASRSTSESMNKRKTGSRPRPLRNSRYGTREATGALELEKRSSRPTACPSPAARGLFEIRNSRSCRSDRAGRVSKTPPGDGPLQVDEQAQDPVRGDGPSPAARSPGSRSPKQAINEQGDQRAGRSTSRAINERGDQRAGPSTSKAINEQGHQRARRSTSRAINKQGAVAAPTIPCARQWFVQWFAALTIPLQWFAALTIPLPWFAALLPRAVQARGTDNPPSVLTSVVGSLWFAASRPDRRVDPAARSIDPCVARGADNPPPSGPCAGPTRNPCWGRLPSQRRPPPPSRAHLGAALGGAVGVECAAIACRRA